MKLIKQFTCLVVCFVLLSSSFMVGYAAEDSYEPIITLEEYIDLGFVEDEYGDYVYYGTKDPFESGISLFSSSSKNFPKFNPLTDIPWTSFPQNIKDIVYKSTDDLSKYEGSFVVPFVSAVVVSQSTVQIFVGLNVGWGWLNDSSFSLAIWSLPTFSAIAASSCLYRLSWNYVNDTVVADWTKYEPNAFGDKNTLKRLLNYYFTDASTVDIYGYGANGVCYAYADNDGSLSALSTRNVLYNSKDNNLTCNFALNPRGFASGRFVVNQDNIYPYIYFDYFTPPTESEILQQEQNETSKGILGTLKEIPDKIQSFFESLKNYLLYFQDTEPEHVNPFSGILDGISSFFDEQLGDTEEFKTSLNTTFDNVSGYIETGSNIINKLLNGVPILNTVLIFFLAFAVIRKVVGR